MKTKLYSLQHNFLFEKRVLYFEAKPESPEKNSTPSLEAKYTDVTKRLELYQSVSKRVDELKSENLSPNLQAKLEGLKTKAAQLLKEEAAHASDPGYVLYSDAALLETKLHRAEGAVAREKAAQESGVQAKAADDTLSAQLNAIGKRDITKDFGKNKTSFPPEMGIKNS